MSEQIVGVKSDDLGMFYSKVRSLCLQGVGGCMYKVKISGYASQKAFDMLSLILYISVT